MCWAWRFCLSVYLDFSPRGITQSSRLYGCCVLPPVLQTSWTLAREATDAPAPLCRGYWLEREEAFRILPRAAKRMPVLRQPGTMWAREHPADSSAEAAQATVHIAGLTAASPPRARLHATSAPDATASRRMQPGRRSRHDSRYSGRAPA